MKQEMKQKVELFFDFVSPYTYLAHSQLHRLDAEIVLRPMHLLTVMKAVNNTPTTMTCEAKGRYAGADLARWCRRYGVTMKQPDMHALCWLQHHPRQRTKSQTRFSMPAGETARH